MPKTAKHNGNEYIPIKTIPRWLASICPSNSTVPLVGQVCSYSQKNLNANTYDPVPRAGLKNHCCHCFWQDLAEQNYILLSGCLYPTSSFRSSVYNCQAQPKLQVKLCLKAELALLSVLYHLPNINPHINSFFVSQFVLNHNQTWI